ncbi:type I-E CRISPR-associated protein Cse2/CasB [Aeromicrobium sp. CTD01-1L150]|uniref:type I-E CRISPR-associated protein Cse2/CasB n=1 Tax=Aeromicrobium sp. CTD01-1L150 TaxID=3341830 RepID=UPI0035C0DB3D
MTQTSPAAPRPHEPGSRRTLSSLAEVVAARVRSLQHQYRHDDRHAVASLARLRRATGTGPGEDPQAWAETLRVIGAEHFGTGSEWSTEEWAAHVALTLFATHQQSHRNDGMHVANRSFGHVVRRLADLQGGEDDEGSRPIQRRFEALATSSGPDEIVHHARSIVGQLRSESVALDYGRLTDDLVGLRDPSRAPSVRLAWGRDYYRTIPDNVPPPNPDQGDPYEPLPRPARPAVRPSQQRES